MKILTCSNKNLQQHLKMVTSKHSDFNNQLEVMISSKHIRGWHGVAKVHGATEAALWQ